MRPRPTDLQCPMKLPRRTAALDHDSARPSGRDETERAATQSHREGQERVRHRSDCVQHRFETTCQRHSVKEAAGGHPRGDRPCLKHQLSVQRLMSGWSSG